ncbi:MAG: HK97 family phage prohead protease, partial [Solirubrobacteraceae bacterium]
MSSNQVELREAGNGKLLMRGYMTVFNKWYSVAGMFDEKINPGAGRRTIAEGCDTVLLVDHRGEQLARTKHPTGGTPTLRLSETSRGVLAEADLDLSLERVRDLRYQNENMGHQMSWGGKVRNDKWNDARSKREVTDISWHGGDATLCAFGMNSHTAAVMEPRSQVTDQERRSYVDTLKGSRERRMCPDLEGYDVEERSELAVATRGQSTIRVPRVPWQPSRGRLQIAKARALSTRMREAPVSRSAIRAARSQRDADQLLAEYATGEMRASSKYTAADVAKLGREGLAHKKLDGSGYNFPAADHTDIKNGVTALGRTPASERPSVR